jgi:hypothetical protein
MDRQAEVFKLSVPEADIADPRERLKHARLPDQAPGPAWAYGTDVRWIRGLVDYWRNDFDWRAEEVRLNAFAQYKVRLDDIDLHFLHVLREKGRIRVHYCYRMAGPAQSPDLFAITRCVRDVEVLEFLK